MGCDIHIAIERRYKKGWVPVNPTPCERPSKENGWKDGWGSYSPTENAVEELVNADVPLADRVPSVSYDWNFGRNYAAFAQLAGVRGRGEFMVPRGAPVDLSKPVFERVFLRLHEDENQGATRSLATQWGSRILEVDGVEYCTHPDWHSISHYTLEELHGHIDSRGKRDVETRILDLTKEMSRIAKVYKIPQSHVRVVFWFDN